MASSDVRDILQLDDGNQKRPIINREVLLADKKKGKKQDAAPKRPENIPREVWHLHADKGEFPSLMPSDIAPVYKQPRLVIGLGRVRTWKWIPFKNSAREDGVQFSHWRRAEDPNNQADYWFAKLNKKPEVVTYSDEEYSKLLESPTWTRQETDYLMEQLQRFDLRFVVVQDRWDKERFSARTVEDIKERYYGLLAALDKARGTELGGGFIYDAIHERSRKEQLCRLYDRTKEQVEEEIRLVGQLKKIELRKKERERNRQDLQKLISQADSVSAARAGNYEMSGALSGGDGTSTSWDRGRRPGPVGSRKRLAPGAGPIFASGVGGQWEGLKFPDLTRNPGVYLRSQRMKLPTNLGQKKTRTIECFLDYFNMDHNPPPKHALVEAFNELRSNILLVHDLRAACNHCDYELQSMRLKFEHLAPERSMPACLTDCLLPNSQSDSSIEAALRSVDSKRAKLIGPGGQPISSGSATTTSTGLAMGAVPTRRRRAAALDQRHVLSRLKMRGGHLHRS